MLLRHAWLPLGIVLVCAGVIWSSGTPLALGVFVLLAGGCARLWANRALLNVEFERLMPETRAFSGERLALTYRITNRKALPLPRLEMRDQLPAMLAPAQLDDVAANVSGAKMYTKATHIGGHERTSWSLELPCPERGYYRLGPAHLRSGDPFGLFVTDREEAATTGVVVYPRSLPLPELGLPAARPIGERRGRERIFEDPLRIAGVRDYEPGDAIRRIDWKATARRGQLQSRVYEPSTTPHLIVALNIDTLQRPHEGYIPELLEGGIAVAASVATWAFKARHAVGLLANGSLPESDRPLRIPPGRSPDHLMRILEALGGIGPMTMTSLAGVLEEESHRLPFGATVVVVAAVMNEPLAAVLRRARGRGKDVVVLSLVEEDWSALLGAVSVQRVDLRALNAAVVTP